MTKYAIDAYAWIAYLEGNDEGLAVKEILESEDNKLYTSAVTFAEVISKLMRQNKNTSAAKEAIFTLSKVIPVDYTTAENAAKHHAFVRNKVKNFGLADAFIMAMADALQLKIVTRDQHFKHFKNVVFI